MTRVPLEQKVLKENDRIAAGLRVRFARAGVLCLNLISSPGAGKTTLLERTLEDFTTGERVAVLTGDIQTDNDAQRLARFGFPVRQITTGGTCHLDARMIERALGEWNLTDVDLLLIENVDKPGVVGKWGTILGANKVNISQMQVALDEQSKKALAVVNIDSAASPKVIQKLRAVTDIRSVRQVKL